MDLFADSEVTTQMNAIRFSTVVMPVKRPGAVFKYPKSRMIIFEERGAFNQLYLLRSDKCIYLFRWRFKRRYIGMFTRLAEGSIRLTYHSRQASSPLVDVGSLWMTDASWRNPFTLFRCPPMWNCIAVSLPSSASIPFTVAFIHNELT